jgi:hypothetical protein
VSGVAGLILNGGRYTGARAIPARGYGDSRVGAMGDAIASGVFALGGAAVGGLASFFATAAEARNRRRDAVTAQRAELTETRRRLYSTLVERADLTADATRRMWAYPTRRIDADDYDAYVATWESYVQARAAVDVAGPRRVAVAATELSRCVSDLCNIVDDWINGERWTDASETRYAKAHQSRVDRRAAFIAIVQDVLSTGS